MERIIEFGKASSLRKVASTYSQVDDNYLFSHIMPGNEGFSDLIEPSPMKFTGSMMLLMRSGAPTKIEVNLEEYEMKPGCLLMIFPGNVVRSIDHLPSDIEAYALYFDPKFLRGININLTSVSVPTPLQKPLSMMQLTQEESDLLVRYFMLVHSATIEEANVQLKKSIVASLTAAMFYQLVLFHHKRLPGEIAGGRDLKPGSRRNEYVREFVRLVHLHYVRERGVAFYADKLFISPKYLSLLVKEATGRSAARWIDEFVLMEAKNMLRFSGKNIQQVAYALNFPTQSSFGKYFKHLTGLSPSEYQKS